MSSRSSSQDGDAVDEYTLRTRDATAQWWVLPPTSSNHTFPAVRDSASLSIYDGRVFVFGGYSDTQNAGEQEFGDLWMGSPISGEEVEYSSGAPLKSPAHAGGQQFPQRSPLVIPSRASGDVPPLPGDQSWSSAGGIRWTQQEPSTSTRPPPLWGHSATVPRNSSSMIVVGGHDLTSRVWSYHFDRREWTAVTLRRSDPWQQGLDFDRYTTTTEGESAGEFPTRYFHSAVEVRWGDFPRLRALGDDNDAAIVIFGGLWGDNACYGDVVVIGPIAPTTEPIAACSYSILTVTGEAPAARFSHGAAAHRGAMYVFGGTYLEDGSEVSSDVYRLELSTRTWSRVDVTGSVPRARFMFSSIVDPLGLWFMCGGQYEGGDTPIEMLSFDMESSRWSTVVSLSGPYPQSVISMGYLTLPTNAMQGDLLALFAMGSGDAFSTGFSDEVLMFKLCDADRRRFVEARTDRPASRAGEDPSPNASGAGDDDRESDRDRNQRRHDWSPGSTLTSSISSVTRPRGNTRPTTVVSAVAPAALRTVTLPVEPASNGLEASNEGLVSAMSTLMDMVHGLQQDLHRRFNDVNRRIDDTNRRVDALRGAIESQNQTTETSTETRLALDRVLGEIRLRR